MKKLDILISLNTWVLLESKLSWGKYIADLRSGGYPKKTCQIFAMQTIENNIFFLNTYLYIIFINFKSASICNHLHNVKHSLNKFSNLKLSFHPQIHNYGTKIHVTWILFDTTQRENCNYNRGPILYTNIAYIPENLKHFSPKEFKNVINNIQLLPKKNNCFYYLFNMYLIIN